MKGSILLLSLCFLATWGQAQRRQTLLDEDWRFHFGHAADPEKDFHYGLATIFSKSGGAAGTAIDPRFRDTAWRRLNLPHDWAVELPFVESASFDVMSHGYKPVGGAYPATSIGWYRKRFPIPRHDSGQRFELQFDGIFRNAAIWLNGFYLGNNESGYIGAAYDITDYVSFDAENVLVVRVDATQYEGWFYEGAGIYRHVWLNQYRNLHIPAGGQFVHSRLSGREAVITVETEVENRNLEGTTCTVYSYVADREGKVLARTANARVTLAVNELEKLKQEIRLPHPRLWSPEDPYRYRVVSIVQTGGKVTDRREVRHGIRTIRIEAARGLFLNGKHIKIKGTNNHQDHAGVGSALPDALQYYRMQLLKEMGCNAYRASHHAPTPELLEACDSLGMLVMDETRLLNSSPEYLSQLERLVRRDRNHPSIFMWSIGNEEGWIQTTTTGKRIAQTVIAKLRGWDPTRTCTYAADLPNVYRGINEVIPVRGFNYRDSAVADYHRDHPGQPIIGTEMGSTVTTRGIYVLDTVRAYVPDQDITSPWWASTAEEWWVPAATNDYWMGGFIWTGFDYRGEPTPFKWPNINSHFGIMDMCGFPKNIYYYYQSWWTDADVLHLSPHWNWPGREGSPVEVWVNTNADEVELLLNGSSLGKKPMPRNSHLKWSVPYAPGRLEAVAVKKGRTLRSHVETTGPAYALVARAHKTMLLADGKDLAVINISVVDREGREVPDAGQLVHFSVRGDAQFIGVGNGDPSSHEPDRYINGEGWKRSLFNGKCQVLLQGGKQSGVIQFMATADGLKPASLTLQANQ